MTAVAAEHPSHADHGHGSHDHHGELPFQLWPADAQYGKASLAKIGMWIFLLSDALMFAGLLLGYGILRGGSDVWRHTHQPDYGINFTAGLTFLLIQAREYTRLGFGPSDNAFASTFFGLTGLHGAHVFVGLNLLLYALIRSVRGHYGPKAEDHLGVELPGIYWHFVDVMWIVVYTTVYVL